MTSLLNELIALKERKNHLGEIEYTTFSAWKSACRKNDSTVWFDGNQDICNAFVGAKPYKRGDTRAIGEWDGTVGSMFVYDGKDKKVAPKSDAPKAEAPPMTEAAKAKGEDMDELLDKWMAQERIHSFEGARGISNFDKLIAVLGYRSMDDFLSDNSGCFEAMIEWIKDVPGTEWPAAMKEALRDEEAT
jgi:hypothetical protein